jgi:hypothetical protein
MDSVLESSYSHSRFAGLCTSPLISFRLPVILQDSEVNIFYLLFSEQEMNFKIQEYEVTKSCCGVRKAASE